MMVIIRYQSILVIHIKWCFYATMVGMGIQICHLGLKMHQLTFCKDPYAIIGPLLV